jgi:hypothetical protein
MKRLALLVLCAGCTNYRTEVMVGILTDFRIPGDLPNSTPRFSMRFSAEHNGVPLFSNCKLIYSEADIPGSIALYSTRGIDTDVDLILDAYQEDCACDPACRQTTMPFVERSSNFALVSSTTLFYRMALVASCKGKQCAADESCVEGICRPKAIDSRVVPHYRVTNPKMESTLQCDSGTNYLDFRAQNAVPHAVPFGCAADEECIEATCYKKLGGPDGGVPPEDLAVPAGADLNLALPACTAATCASLGATCGTRSDGCGNILTCGPMCQVASFGPAGNLAPPRTAFAVLQTNSRVFLLGGEDGSFAATAGVQSAIINPDGTLGPFIDSGALTQARESVSAVAVGPFVYVLGGQTNDAVAIPAATSVVERAPLNPDGTIGSFSAAGSLASPRDSHASVAVKRWLYVLGGEDTNLAALRTVERALINADGTLGPFGGAGSLLTARISPAVIVTPDFVYVIGGSAGGRDLLDSVERAPITADGSLGRFVDAGFKLAIPRGGAGLALLGNDAYLIGGRTSAPDGGTGFLGGVEHAAVDVSGVLSPFSPLGAVSLGMPRGGPGVALTGNGLYVIGGIANGPAILASIERAGLQ